MNAHSRHHQTSGWWALLCGLWQEVLLLLAVIVLLMQLFPSLGSGLLALIDPRSWAPTTLFVGNLGMVCVLISIRFGPVALGWYHERSEHRRQIKAKAMERAMARERRQRSAEMRRRYKEGRDRRIF